VDWDEDGDKDLLVGEYSGYVRHYENIGTASVPVLTYRGQIQAGGSAIHVNTLSIPVVNDWDQDGRKDLIVGNNDANIRVYLNVGTNASPMFESYFLMPATPAIAQIKNGPDIGDLNNDGLKDLAYGWWQGTIYYYGNSGTNANPVLTGGLLLTALGTNINVGWSASGSGWTHLEMNDWNEDGHLDLIYGQWSGTVQYYKNVTHLMSATVTPQSVPVVIPAGGGTFNFTGTLTNGAASHRHRLDPAQDAQRPVQRHHAADGRCDSGGSHRFAAAHSEHPGYGSRG
jgi:hypothetical protein